MLQRRGRNHAIRRTERPAGQLVYPVQPAPPRRNRLRDGQVAIERLLQTRTPRGVWRGSEARFQLADAHPAQKQCADILRRHPVGHFERRAGTHQLGRDVGVQQKTAVHERSTGRAVEGLRLNATCPQPEFGLKIDV